MHRGVTGDYESAVTTGDSVRAFVPRSLPPDPALALGNSRQRLLERATLALPYKVPNVHDRPWAEIWVEYHEKGMKRPEKEIFKFN